MTASTAAPATPTFSPGRTCPLSYRYSPEVFRRSPELRSETIYVIGGLYGNPFALDRIIELSKTEPRPVDLVFNGDFNWFDVDAESFTKVNETVLRHAAIRGNVETELAHDDDSDGCGCAYPDWVEDQVVSWSNQIMRRLRDSAREFPSVCQKLAALPMHLVAEVGGVRIAIVHGDAASLAGWSFSHEVLSSRSADVTLRKIFDEANVSLFASSHTCLPVVRTLARDGATNNAIINNGAAGMPNLHGTTFGLVTRISTRPTRLPSAFGMQTNGLHVDLMKVDIDHSRWLTHFERNWPSDSPGSLSYRERIVNGPRFTGPIAV